MEFFWQGANIVDTLASQRTETAGSVRLHSCKSIRLHDLTNRLCYSLSMYYI